MASKMKEFVHCDKLRGILGAILFVLNAINITGRNTVYFFPDEVGYWASGALINGVNWNRVMSLFDYYGYGYGLILAIVFRINSPYYRYYCAVLINFIFVVLSYYLLTAVMRRITNVNKKIIDICCFISMLYPAVTVYTHMTMCEVFLTFLYLLSIYLLERFANKCTLSHGILLSMTLALMVGTHMRNVVIICTCTVTLFCLYVYKKRTNGNHALNVVITFILMVVFVGSALFIKKIIIDTLYFNGDMNIVVNGGNNSSIFKLVGYYFYTLLGGVFSIAYWKSWGISIIGKVVYFLISTMLLVIFGTKQCVTKIKQYKFEAGIIYLYILLSFYGVFLLTVAIMKDYVRMDGLLYGRYADPYLAPLLMLGLVSLFEKQHKRSYFLCVTVTLLCSIVLYRHILGAHLEFSNGSAEFLPLEIPGLAGYDFFGGNVVQVFFITIPLVFCIICLLVYGVLHDRFKTQLILLAIVWVIVAERTLYKDLFVGQWTTERFEEIALEAENMNDSNQVFCLITDDNFEGRFETRLYWSVAYLQWFLGDICITPITESQLEQYPLGENIIVFKCMPSYEKYKETPIWENDLAIIKTY